jgi:hypothetical protein
LQMHMKKLSCTFTTCIVDKSSGVLSKKMIWQNYLRFSSRMNKTWNRSHVSLKLWEMKASSPTTNAKSVLLKFS